MTMWHSLYEYTIIYLTIFVSVLTCSQFFHNYKYHCTASFYIHSYALFGCFLSICFCKQNSWVEHYEHFKYSCSCLFCCSSPMYPFFRYTKFTQGDKLLGSRVHALPVFTVLGAGMALVELVQYQLTTMKVFEGVLENPEEKLAYFSRESRY